MNNLPFQHHHSTDASSDRHVPRANIAIELTWLPHSREQVHIGASGLEKGLRNGIHQHQIQEELSNRTMAYLRKVFCSKAGTKNVILT